jgi:hypothetical protein
MASTQAGSGLSSRMAGSGTGAPKALCVGMTPAQTDYYMETPGRKALLLGYAGVAESDIAPAVRRLARALADEDTKRSGQRLARDQRT